MVTSPPLFLYLVYLFGLLSIEFYSGCYCIEFSPNFPTFFVILFLYFYGCVYSCYFIRCFVLLHLFRLNRDVPGSFYNLGDTSKLQSIKKIQFCWKCLFDFKLPEVCFCALRIMCGYSSCTFFFTQRDANTNTVTKGNVPYTTTLSVKEPKCVVNVCVHKEIGKFSLVLLNCCIFLLW